MPWRGVAFPSGAQKSGQRELKSLTRRNQPRSFAAALWGWRVSPSLSSPRGFLTAIDQWRLGPVRSCHTGPFARRH